MIENYINLCAVIGCFPTSMKRAGIEIKNHYFSEIDKYAISTYKYNFPNAIYIGAIGHFLDNAPKRADFISFGFPCQDLSIAGKRKGISTGTRSGLVFEIANILNHYKPRHFFAENVPGLLSHAKGSTIMEILNLFTDLGTDCMQYDVEMQFLNTRNFGIPQNRERLYFIGYNLATRTSGQKVFPLTQSDCGTDEGATETTVIATFTAGGHSGGHHSGMTLLETQQPILAVNGNGNLPQVPVSTCIDANYHKGMDNHSARTVVLSDSGRNHKMEEQSMAVPSLRNGHADANVVIHNLQPRNGKGIGGKGHLSKEDTASYAIDTSNSQGIEIKQKAYTKGNSQGQRVFDLEGIEGAIPSNESFGKALYEFEGKTIRRFVPIEVEKLFGLIPDYTKFGINEKGETVLISDSRRYSMCGNGIPMEPLTTIFRKFKQCL